MTPPPAQAHTADDQLPSWLHSRMVLWAAAVMAGMLIIGAAGFAWWERENAIASGLERVEMLARALDDQSTRAIDTAAILTNAFAEDLTRYDATGHSISIEQMLAQAIAGSPFIRSFSLVSQDGHILASSNKLQRSLRLDIAPLIHSSAQERLQIGAPIPGRDLSESTLNPAVAASEQPLPLSFVPLTRPLTLRDGQQAYAVLSFNTDYLANSFELMLADAGRSAALLRYDGTPLAATTNMRLPSLDQIKEQTLFRQLLPERDHGSLVGPSLAGEKSLVAFRASRRWPLVVVVEQELNHALTGWASTMRISMLALVLGLIVLTSLSMAAWRSLRSNEQARRTLQRLHREVARSEARKSAILESAMDGMATLDARGHILEFNHEAESIFGHAAHTVLGQSLDALVLPTDAQGALNVMVLAAGASPQHLVAGDRKEMTARRANGQTFPLEVSIVPVECADEVLLSCTMRDISQARQAAAERELLLARYRDSSASLRTLKHALDHHAIVSIFSPEGRFLYANRKLLSVSGYSREELDGHTVQLLRPLQGTEPVLHDLLALIQAGNAWEGQLVHRSKDGQLYWASSTLVPDKNAEGQLTQMFLIQTDISQQIAGERAIEAAHQAEIALGAGIQQALLTRELPLEVVGCFLAGFNVASQGINGDFFDLFQPGEDCLDILVGDAMGKGVPAALLGAGFKMQFARSLTELHLRNTALPTPAQIIAHVQQAMHQHLEELESFVTVCYVRIDRRHNTLTWVGCGHEEILLFDASGQHHFLNNQHPPLGVVIQDHIAQSQIALEDWKTIVLYSDGITDALGANGERFGMGRLVAQLQGLLHSHQRPGTMARGMHSVVQAYMAGAKVVDDMTMLVLQPAPMHAELHEHRFEMPRSMQRLSQLHAFVESQSLEGGLPAAEASAFALAAVELASNAIRHSQQSHGRLEFIFGYTPTTCTIELFYPGRPFTPPAELSPDFSGESEGGFGLYIIQQSCDEVTYAHSAGINRVVLSKKRPIT